MLAGVVDRLAVLVAHVVGTAALWWWVRVNFGPEVGLFGAVVMLGEGDLATILIAIMVSHLEVVVLLNL